MAVRIPAQRAEIDDGNGRVSAPWWQFFSGMATALNAKRCTASSTAYSHTGTATQTVAATIPVLAGTRGIVRLTLCFTMTANANPKTVLVTLGNTDLQTYTLDNAASASVCLCIVGTGKSSQTAFTSSTHNATTASATVLGTEDMTNPLDITVSLTLGTITDTVSLDCWALEVEQN